MTRRQAIAILGVILLLGAGASLIYAWSLRSADIQSPAPTPTPTACTMEAKLCPDGSYVGRTEPSCEFSACPSVDVHSRMTVGLGQSVEGLGLTVVPLEVIEDSRCPTDVQCIQAGTVRLRTQVGFETTTTTVVLKLNEAVNVQGKVLVLVEVRPDAWSTKPISSGDYRFTFDVSE
ncbi:hypothetical protein KKH15_02035 [Patescibacteria group bacterium]|nr:hypothetical protein [Patescibacteria group bacterium]MBU1754695.1 hypothetical protein [Patescibacteria group bacterium]